MIRKNIEAKIVKSQDEKDDLLTAYASVEAVDLEGDIIRIDGIDCSLQDIAHIPIFPDHTYYFENSGEPAVIGRVEKLWKDKYQNTQVPSLCFSMSWAKNDKGELTNLAKAYKDMYKSGYISGFSVGLDRVACDNTKTGKDWKQTKLMEISATALPANQYARIIKSLLNKYNMENKSLEVPTLNPIGVAGEGYTYTKKDMDDAMTMHVGAIKDHVDKCYKSMADHVDGCHKAVMERLDDMESSIVAGADNPVAQDGPTAEYKSKAKQEISSKQLSDALDEIRKVIRGV